LHPTLHFAGVIAPQPEPNGAQALPAKDNIPVEEIPVRKFSFKVPPGKTNYTVNHPLASTDVIVQTRIRGRIREGGITIVDANTIQLEFGGTLNEQIDGVIIG
jgi:hypothetical protein